MSLMAAFLFIFIYIHVVLRYAGYVRIMRLWTEEVLKEQDGKLSTEVTCTVDALKEFLEDNIGENERSILRLELPRPISCALPCH